MAMGNRNAVPLLRQPVLCVPSRSESQQMDDVLMVLNVAERIHILSEGTLSLIDDGTSLAVVRRRIETLHNELLSLSRCAERSKYVSFSYTDAIS